MNILLDDALVTAAAPSLDEWLGSSYEEFRLKAEARGMAAIPESEWRSKKKLLRDCAFATLYRRFGLDVPDEFLGETRWEGSSK